MRSRPASGTQTGPERALATVIGTAAGATGCALTFAGERYRWGDGDSWFEHVVTYGGEQQGVLAIAPESAGPLPGVAAHARPAARRWRAWPPRPTGCAAKATRLPASWWTTGGGRRRRWSRSAAASSATCTTARSTTSSRCGCRSRSSSTRGGGTRPGGRPAGTAGRRRARAGRHGGRGAAGRAGHRRPRGGAHGRAGQPQRRRPATSTSCAAGTRRWSSPRSTSCAWRP